MTVATLGPVGSQSWQTARHSFGKEAEIRCFPLASEVVRALSSGQVEHAVIPVYNTREGEMRDYFRAMEKLERGYWCDNLVLPVQLSLGSLDLESELTLLIGTSTALRQSGEYTAAAYPSVSQLAVADPAQAMDEICGQGVKDRGVIDSEENLLARGLVIRQREVAPHNQTRFAIIGPKLAPRSGYDATAFLTRPLKDRVGLLSDILGEFTRRGINLLDMRTESDIKTQKLQIYIEAEGHIEDDSFAAALRAIERDIIHEPGAIRVLGSFPRVDMRPKHIRSVGFIGTGDMSVWFARRLENEGYKCLLSGRSTTPKPEEMIPEVDVVAVCVPISATAPTIRAYGPLLRDGQAMILLAGEAEGTIQAALESTSPGVEVMLVHNLWGPQAATMKDKNVSLVRTPRSGRLCSEFEAFLYKHGADISMDTASSHDLLMGVGQKLPTSVSVALAMTLRQNGIATEQIGSHSTLTSLYGILAMCRMHTQNPRTYAEIMATGGDGRKIVRDFMANLASITELADAGERDAICRIIETNRDYLTPAFLEARMRQSLAVDETLGKIIVSRSQEK